MIAGWRHAVTVSSRRIAGRARRGFLPGVLLGGLTFLPFPGSAVGAELGAGVGIGARLDAGSGVGAFPVIETARREQAALIASAGGDPTRWPVAEIRAVAVRWNAAAREASGARLAAPLLRERWNLVLNAAADAWSGFALKAGTPVPADSLALLSSDALALGDDAAAILPAIRAVSEGRRAALLLTTSVGCECTMQRVALMEDVWTALAAGGSGSPEPAVVVRSAVGMGTEESRPLPGRDLRPFLGRSDLAASPDLPDAFELDRVPGWLLLEPGGGVVFRVDGGEGVAPITTMIRRWLGGEDLRQ